MTPFIALGTKGINLSYVISWHDFAERDALSLRLHVPSGEQFALYHGEERKILLAALLHHTHNWAEAFDAFLKREG